MSKYIIILIGLISILSCKKEVNIDIPNNERKIVLNSVLFADSVFSVNIYKSNHIQDKTLALLYLNNAKVDILEGGNLLETLKLDSAGCYIGDKGILAQEGHNYEIVVNVPNLKQVKAKVGVLKQVPIISIDSIGEEQYDFDHRGEMDVNKFTIYQVKFKDIPNEKNYYRLKVNLPLVVDTLYNYDSTKYTIYKHYADVGIQTEDPVIELTNETDGYYYFSDILFDGKEYNFNISIMPDFVSDIYSEDGMSFKTVKESYKDDITISLEHISYEMFIYMKSVVIQHNTQGAELFFQAAPVYINVEDGFGIVGTSNVDKKNL